MAERVDWNSFARSDGHTSFIPVDPHRGGAPSAEDQIHLAEEANVVAPDQVEIGLATESHITWWKGIRIWVRDGGEGAVDTLNSYHGPTYLRVRVDLLPGGRLELQKAKMFGAHTGMYELDLGAIAHRGGTRFTFTWQRDG